MERGKHGDGRYPRIMKAGPEEAAEHHKGSVRAMEEHPFLYVKRHFDYRKVRYRGLAKNTQRISLLLGFSILLIAGRYAAVRHGASVCEKPPGAGQNPLAGLISGAETGLETSKNRNTAFPKRHLGPCSDLP